MVRLNRPPKVSHCIETNYDTEYTSGKLINKQNSFWGGFCLKTHIYKVSCLFSLLKHIKFIETIKREL